MSTPSRAAALVALLAVLAPALVRAQESTSAPAAPFVAPGAPRPSVATPRVPLDRALAFTLGLGVVAPAIKSGEQVDGNGTGLYASAEYVFRASSWFSPRVYGGLEVAPSDDDCGLGVSPCDVSASFGFAGVKGRILAPIPWVAPFFEVGLGISAGRFTTRVGTVYDIDKTGLAYHIPWALGLALGKERTAEVSFQYLEHPALKQTAGGVAVGIRFGLD